jgi:hypothetical protein
VRFFRREPLHRRLARELEATGDADVAAAEWRPLPHADEVGIHGVPRARRWDAVVTAEATAVPGDEVRFAALPDGSLLVDDDVPDGALEPLAEAVEAAVPPPYRAEAVRRDEQVWAVGARRIEVVELPDDVAGDEVDLAVQGVNRTLVVDGERTFGRIPRLEALGESRHANYVVHAERLDGTLWEVRVAAL